VPPRRRALGSELKSEFNRDEGVPAPVGRGVLADLSAAARAKAEPAAHRTPRSIFHNTPCGLLSAILRTSPTDTAGPLAEGRISQSAIGGTTKGWQMKVTEENPRSSGSVLLINAAAQAAGRGERSVHPLNGTRQAIGGMVALIVRVFRRPASEVPSTATGTNHARIQTEVTPDLPRSYHGADPKRIRTRSEAGSKRIRSRSEADPKNTSSPRSRPRAARGGRVVLSARAWVLPPSNGGTRHG